MSRSQLERLEAAGHEERSVELLVSLAWLCLPALPLPDDELKSARRRALFVLAAGGDPHRDLGFDSVAAERLAAELDTPARRDALRDALAALDTSGLPTVSAAVDALASEPELAWRCLGLALLADELAEE